jgi:hypothetical protein
MKIKMQSKKLQSYAGLIALLSLIGVTVYSYLSLSFDESIKPRQFATSEHSNASGDQAAPSKTSSEQGGETRKDGFVRESEINKTEEVMTAKTFTPSPIQNLPQFIAFIESIDGNTSSVDNAVDFLNGSEQALLYLQNKFEILFADGVDNLDSLSDNGPHNTLLDSAKRAKQNLLIDMLYITTNQYKVATIESLINSQNEQVRLNAYRLLNAITSTSEEKDLLTDMLIAATHQEQEGDSLHIILSSIELDEEECCLLESAEPQLIERLRDLTFHEDSKVAAVAIFKLSDASRDDKTRDILNSHLSFSPPAIQHQALKALRKFTSADEDLLFNIESIMNDENQSQEMRGEAARVLVSLENAERN